MDISVVVCTYNRCQVLATALESIAQSTLPGSISWEVVVVDNNSSDQTPEIVKNLCQQHPGRFRYVFEPRPGKSYALNTGVLQSQGAIIAFADDDTTVELTWLDRLTAPLRCGDWSGSGGPVILQWSCPRPTWLTKDATLAPLAGLNPDRLAGEISEPILYGGNLALRRTMFESYGGFRTDLGPSPNRETPRPNEDTEYVRRLLLAGERLFYEPSAVVFHPVPASRLRKSYFLNWWFDKGRADFLIYGVSPEMKWRAGGIPVSFLRRIARWTVSWAIALEPSERFSNRVKVQWLLGNIVEARRQSRKAAAPEIEIA